MQTAPKRGPGRKTRPSRERVDVHDVGSEVPVFGPCSQGVEDAGNLVRQGNGRPDRSSWRRGGDGGGLRHGTANPMEHFSRESPPRKEPDRPRA
jgi:hypothetical protein